MKPENGKGKSCGRDRDRTKSVIVERRSAVFVGRLKMKRESGKRKTPEAVFVFMIGQHALVVERRSAMFVILAERKDVVVFVKDNKIGLDPIRTRQSLREPLIFLQPAGRGFCERAFRSEMIRSKMARGRLFKSRSAARSRRTSCTGALLSEEIFQVFELERLLSHFLKRL
jgi:hypothetical protein